jgi:hypothetical protein
MDYDVLYAMTAAPLAPTISTTDGSAMMLSPVDRRGLVDRGWRGPRRRLGGAWPGFPGDEQCWQRDRGAVNRRTRQPLAKRNGPGHASRRPAMPAAAHR